MRARETWVCGVMVLAAFARPVSAQESPSAQAPHEEAPPAAQEPAPPSPPELVPVPPQTYAPPAPAAPAYAPQQPAYAPQQPVNPPQAVWPSGVESNAPERAVSLTVSPLHLLSPIVELTLEVAAAQEVGIALLVGIGSVGVKTDGASSSSTATELGASLRYYAIGDFSAGGMQLGAEVLWVHIFVDTDVDGSSTSATGSGVAVGPMIGYKYVAHGGFTFDGQLGVQWMNVSAESGSETAEASGIIPLLNVNLGWSF